MRPYCLLPALVVISACSVGPDYQRPDSATSPSYKELSGWKPSAPADEADRGTWWSIYQDPILADLEAQVEVSNQNLKAQEAAYVQAVAVARAARSGFYPTLDATPSFKRATVASSTKTKVGNTIDVSGTASWDLDVWGKIRRTVEADEASAQASAGDLASAKLSLQSQLAIDYFELRVQDQLIRILEEATEAYGQSLRITQNQYKVGIASRADVAQAETQLKSTQASLINVGVLRGQLEHAIAVLTGRVPADLTIAAAVTPLTVPVSPTGVPSALLERRPDIAAAERRVAAANAEIGVAIAAYYPDLSLSAALGYASQTAAGLFQTANRVWSFGPQLSQTLFNGGLTGYQVDQAKATWEQSVATYRQTVLTAFQQVEDELTALKVYEREATVQADAIKSAHEAERLILNQYKAGTVAYTSVVTAQTAALTDEENALTVMENRLVASVTLIQALGGGWSAAQIPVIE